MSTTSHRTIIRDAVLNALSKRQGDSGMRTSAFDVSPNFLSFEECKRFPTYCVIVTDESPNGFTNAERECQLTIVIVILVKDAGDVRAALDASIEDVYETVMMAQQSLLGTAWRCALESITADEGATATKPHAQAVQRWVCSHGRTTR